MGAAALPWAAEELSEEAEAVLSEEALLEALPEELLPDEELPDEELPDEEPDEVWVPALGATVAVAGLKAMLHTE